MVINQSNPQNQTPIELKPNHLFKNLALIFSIFILIAAVSAGTYLLGRNQGTQTRTINLSPTPTPTPISKGLTLSALEKDQIDTWIKKNNLNQYGDSMDTMYVGGTPLFNEATGQTTDRYIYIADKHPDRPWCTPRPACLDTTPKCMIAETPEMCPVR